MSVSFIYGSSTFIMSMILPNRHLQLVLFLFEYVYVTPIPGSILTSALCLPCYCWEISKESIGRTGPLSSRCPLRYSKYYTSVYQIVAFGNTTHFRAIVEHLVTTVLDLSVHHIAHCCGCV